MEPQPPQPESLVLPHTLPRERLDRHLARLLPGITRGTLQRLITGGHLLVNGQPARATATPRAGDVVSIAWPAPRPLNLEPEDHSLEILYEDGDLLVVNKPAGMAVHPGAGHAEGTLVHALLHHCRGTLSGIGGVERPGIVHRLDLDTTGCLVVARNDLAHVRLAEQFKQRTTEKIYHCLVCGVLEPSVGEIRAPITRHPTDRHTMAVGTPGRGRDAHTTFRRLEVLTGASLVEARIHTGRTHQIRVHFRHIRHPILGDATYGRNANQRFKSLTGLVVPRQMLHARRLVFTHPRTGERCDIVAPLPADFEALLDALRNRPVNPGL